MTIKVLFVCMGNICRSPMAEAVFQDMVNKAGLADQITLDSAGTGGWHEGEQADPRTLEILRKHDIPYAGRARQIKASDLQSFDYILVMDRENLSAVMRLINRGTDPSVKSAMLDSNTSRPEVGLFLSYANRAGVTTTQEVPDPYYNDRFDLVFELVKKGCEALLAHIRTEHPL